MSTGAIIGIIIAVIVVAAVIARGPVLLRQVRMRRQFGPEYERLAKELGFRKAAAELTARQRRVDALGIHPLSAEQQASYSGEWTAVQERFVDSPAAAVSEAGTLIWAVMRDRGYPADDRNASMEALSVYHARPLDGYRKAQSLRASSASTEDLRKAMISYRTLFQDLVGMAAGKGQLFRRPSAITAQRRPAGTGDHTRKITIMPQKTTTAARASNRTAGTPR
jgi:hypothetical protein